MRPMLATPGAPAGAVPTVPSGPKWAHEVKWDGVRLLADVRGGRVRLTTRTERDISVAFPELAGLATLAPDVVLDGEVVVLDNGVPSFGRLAERLHTTSARVASAAAAKAPVRYFAFDLLRLDDLDLTRLPWHERRRALEALLQDAEETGAHLSPVYQDGAQLLAATNEQGLEGVISKSVDSRYFPGARSKDWLKFPHRHTFSVVVGGWRPEAERSRLGALLVGTPMADGRLSFRGRVGSGLAGRAGAQLEQLLGGIVRQQSPFDSELAALDAKGARWVEPTVVVDVYSLGLTAGLRLRQPSYRGHRTDLTPADLTTANSEQ